MARRWQFYRILNDLPDLKTRICRKPTTGTKPDKRNAPRRQKCLRKFVNLSNCNELASISNVPDRLLKMKIHTIFGMIVMRRNLEKSSTRLPLCPHVSAGLVIGRIAQFLDCARNRSIGNVRQLTKFRCLVARKVTREVHQKFCQAPLGGMQRGKSISQPLDEWFPIVVFHALDHRQSALRCLVGTAWGGGKFERQFITPPDLGPPALLCGPKCRLAVVFAGIALSVAGLHLSSHPRFQHSGQQDRSDAIMLNSASSSPFPCPILIYLPDDPVARPGSEVRMRQVKSEFSE